MEASQSCQALSSSWSFSFRWKREGERTGKPEDPLKVLWNRFPLHNDVVNGNMDELDEEADESHQEETHSNSLADLEVLCDQEEEEEEG